MNVNYIDSSSSYIYIYIPLYMYNAFDLWLCASVHDTHTNKL